MLYESDMSKWCIIVLIMLLKMMVSILCYTYGKIRYQIDLTIIQYGHKLMKW